MDIFGPEKIKLEINNIIEKDLGYKYLSKYSIMQFTEETLIKKYGQIHIVKFNPYNSTYPMIVIPEYSIISFIYMLEIIIKNFPKTCVLHLFH